MFANQLRRQSGARREGCPTDGLGLSHGRDGARYEGLTPTPAEDNPDEPQQDGCQPWRLTDWISARRRKSVSQKWRPIMTFYLIYRELSATGKTSGTARRSSGPTGITRQ